MVTPDTAYLWLMEHTVAILKEMAPEPEFMTTLELSGRLEEMAVACEDQEKANVMDAAACRLCELLETIDRLRGELAFYVNPSSN